MRSIIFRGKSLKNKKWVYGDLMRNICATRIVCYKETDNESGQRADWDYIEVDDSTVGQYIGLKDRNGKEIYEGDILHYTRKRIGEEDKEYYREVTFHNGCFCMYVPNHFTHSGLCNHIVNGILDWEVVGNKFDNPEMLK